MPARAAFSAIRSRRVRLSFSLLLLSLFAVLIGIRACTLGVRATYHHAASYNEGWNTYYSHYAAVGHPLYGTKPQRLATNYPPISFHLEAALGRLLGDLNFAGRIISIVAFIWVATCTGFTVRLATGESWAAISATFFCVAWFSPFAPYNIGVNDPQMLAHALMLTGVVLYAASERSTPILVASCVFFCIGGFTKHSLLAFPLAVTLDILWRSRLRFAFWIGTAAVTLTLLALLTLWVDGPYLLEHLLSPRRYLPSRALFISSIFFRIYLPGLVLSTIWCLTAARRSRARFLALALPISLLVGVAFAGGSGVSVNVLYDAWIAIAMIAAMVLADAIAIARKGSLRTSAVAIVAVAIASAVPILAGFYSAVPPRAVLAQEDRVYAQDVAYLKNRPGPAICFDLLLCYEAGKPLFYEPFATGERIATGRLDPNVIASELANLKYSVIQTDQGVTYFPPTVLDALNSHYRIDRQSALSVFYVPLP